ncbi:hypothetical protein [Wenzhouxiangella sediminis]|jgi:hypothetical protein|uniref:DUF3568 family protein n=1 Tax=Wenzhouxiangella sediminis TaxID=1792836 RepID=A0A3E1K7G8_9GAMM|nr:hypothetical protein [Wenzhouxiangella sediminis]MEE4303774.1 hypothetical protein [Wenzhouxiangella sp.]RFF29923.1 hypothetical protein DZC52_10840 [Wenzhouxiangella sediminis]
MKFLNILLFVFTALAAAGPQAIASPANGQGDVDFGAKLSAEAEDALVSFQDSLERITSAKGARITDVSVDQSMSNDGDFSTLNTSCTASATVGSPGGTEVTIEATAPTCTQAVEMVQNAVQDLMDDLDIE